jgi:hypothetical protein
MKGFARIKALLEKLPQLQAKRRQRLERLVEKARRAQAVSARAMYDLASALATVARERLYLFQGHPSFGAFVDQLGLVGRSQAYKLMTIANELSRDQLAELGVERAYQEALARKRRRKRTGGRTST